MAIEFHACRGPEEFPAISEFLFGLYEPDNRDGNWLQPVWEYAYTHPWFDDASIDRIGIWTEGPDIVGVAFREGNLALGSVFSAKAAVESGKNGYDAGEELLTV